VLAAIIEIRFQGILNSLILFLTTKTIPVMNCPSRRSASLYRVDIPSFIVPIGNSIPIKSVPRGDYAINFGDSEPDEANISAWPLFFMGPQSMSSAKQITQANVTLTVFSLVNVLCSQITPGTLPT